MFLQKRQSGWMCPWVLSFLLVTLCGSDLCWGQAQPATTKESVAAILRQGVDLAAQGQLAEAEAVLERAQALAPRNTEVLTTLAKVKARMGETPSAAELFREVAAILPLSPEAHLNLAIALADNANFPEALQEVTKAVELSPKSGLAHLNRARILSDLHRQSSAEAEFAIASRLSPSNPECFFYWALLEREMGNYAKESSLLRTVVRLQPRNDEAYVLLGASLSYQSKQSEAISCWREALAINPNSQKAVYNLSRALRATDPEESKKLESKFHALQQDSRNLEQVKALGNQAYVAMNHGNWPLAITTLKHAIALCDTCEASAGLHKDLGLALCDNGDFSAGRDELQIALHLNPDDPDIIKALSILAHR